MRGPAPGAHAPSMAQSQQRPAAAAGEVSQEAAKARGELRERYERTGFAAPLHALGAAEAAPVLAACRRFEEVHKRRLCEHDSAREMNHAWLPWLRQLGRHDAIVGALRDAFCTRHICLYATELLTFPPHQSSQVASWDWQTDGPAYSPLLKPVDRRHFATVFLVVSAGNRSYPCLRMRPTAAGGKASSVDVAVNLRPGEFSLHGPSTKYAFCPNNSGDFVYGVVLRYIRASTVDPHSEELGKEDVLLVSGADEKGNFDEMPEFPAEATDDGRDLRELMMEQRRDKVLAGEVLKGREGLKKPLIDPSAYTVTKTLMYGTFKTIHVAKWGSSRKQVVVKRVQNQRCLLYVRKHFHEAHIMEKLSHPCILQLVGLVDGLEQLDMILEYCEDGVLTSFVQKCPRQDVLQLMCDLFCALAYMHEEGFAHLDVKPNNVLVSSGRGKLCDFETAVQLPRSGKMYLSGIGTPGFRAPELDKPMECDARAADVWSLGKCGEFVNDFAKGCWSGMQSLTADVPESRPSIRSSLELFRRLNGGGLILT